MWIKSKLTVHILKIKYFYIRLFKGLDKAEYATTLEQEFWTSWNFFNKRGFTKKNAALAQSETPPVHMQRF